MRFRLAAAALAWFPALLAASKPPTISPALYRELRQKIVSTDISRMDADFLKEIYKGFSGAKYMLKSILADPQLEAKNQKLGRVRRALDLQFWAEVARRKGITIELTDSGKTNGHRSDLDETGWALVGPDGELVRRGRAFDELKQMHDNYFSREYGITPEQADVTVMDGDIFLPDYRSAHMGSTEFVRDLADKVLRLRRDGSTYSVPGGNKQQVYNRTLEEGRALRIAPDAESGKVLANGTPLDLPKYVEGSAPLPEMPARLAMRYRGVEAFEPSRLSLGNAIENLGHYLSTSGEPVSRQKYGNRIVDEAFGPMTGQLGKYSRIHGRLAPGLPDTAAVEAWKKNFIEQIYGVTSGPEFDEVRRVLDISADIELDKIGRGPGGEKRDYQAQRSEYYQGEIAEARSALAAEGHAEPSPEQVLAKAEQLFVAKHVRVLARGLIPVLKETLRRDLTAEGRKQYRADFGENFHLGVRKMLFERKIELAAMFETLDLIPDEGLRESLRRQILETAPNPEVRSLLEQMSKLAAVDGAFDEWLKAAARSGRTPSPDEVLTEMERRKSAVVGAAEGKEVSRETLEKIMLRGIVARLGPGNGPDFLEAYRQLKAAARQLPGQAAQEFYQGLGVLPLGATALNLVRTYQQECSLGGKSGPDCSRALLATAAQESLSYIPRAGSPYLVVTSLKSINEGNAEGFLTLGLGTMAVAGFPGFMQVYFVYQIGKTGWEVTYGYTIQSMQSDQVQQAFTSRPVPGGKAERNPYAESPGSATTDMPNFPLLFEIDVPANQWSQEQKLAEAKKRFGTTIRLELQKRGVTVDAPEWKPQFERELNRYAFDLPYYQRVDKIYQHFGPAIDRYEQVASSADMTDHSFDAMEACMEAHKEDKESPFPRCLQRAIEETSPVLDAFFNRYVTTWLKQQSEGYQQEYSSTLDRLLLKDTYRQEMFQKLKGSLIRDYVLHQWMERRKEGAAAEMERQTRQLLSKVKRLEDLEKGRIASMNRASQSLLERYEAQSTALYAQKLPPVPPKIKVDWPDFAQRIGSPGPAIGVTVRGEYSGEEAAPQDQWEAVFEAKAVSVKDGAPENLLRTPELEEELKPVEGQPRKTLVTVEDQVKVTVKSKSGEVLGTETGTIYWYDVVEAPAPFQGTIHVTVVEGSSAGPRAPYAGAQVSLEKEVRATDASGSAAFEVNRAGAFTVAVQPRAGDSAHQAATAQVTLTDPLQSNDPAQPQSGKPSQSVTVVLAYRAPAQAPDKPEPPAVAQAPPDARAPSRQQEPSASPDAQLQADCSALLERIKAVRSSLDRAAPLLEEAMRRNCTSLPGVGDGLAQLADEMNRARQERESRIQELQAAVQARSRACDFEGALAAASELQSFEPSALPPETLGRMQELAARQAAIRGLLAEAQGPVPDDQLPELLGQLEQALATAPECWSGPLQSALAQLRGRSALSALRARIRAAVAACDFLKALDASHELQTLAPDDPWLKANFGLIESMATQQDMVRQLAQAAREMQPENLGPVVARLRQALSTAPGCMTDQVQAALREAESRMGGQRPAWLVMEPPKNDGESPASRNIDRVRDSLLTNIQQDEQRRIQREEETRQRAELARLEAERRRQEADEQDERRRREEELAEQRRQKEEEALQRRQSAERRRQAVAGLLGTLGSVLSAARVPVPSIPSIPGGSGPRSESAPPAAAADPFSGTWQCHMQLTNSRKMKLDGSVQGDYTETISKRGNGYILIDGRSGSTMPSTFVGGNTIRFGAASSEGQMSVEFQASGNSMTGTLRGSNSEDTMSASLRCRR